MANEKATLFRYHPQTGQDAEDFTAAKPETWTVDGREALARERQWGEKFYWTDFGHKGEYGRCGYKNIKFALDVIGVAIEIVTEKPKLS